MRLNKRWQRLVFLKKKTVKDDGEGGFYDDYSDIVTEIKANIQPLSSRVQAEVYGEKINDMRSMFYDGDIEINEGDGISIGLSDDSKPNFKVISKKQYQKHTLFELEKI